MRYNKDSSKEKRERRILGNKKCGILPYVFAIILNIIFHYFFYSIKSVNLLCDVVFFCLSFLAFTYIFCFIMDFIWSIRPSVLRILNDKEKINRKYYMNVINETVNVENLNEVTISIPVYLEENEVIFNTIKTAIEAIKFYTTKSSKKSNIIISDDGLAVFLNNNYDKTI